MNKAERDKLYKMDNQRLIEMIFSQDISEVELTDSKFLVEIAKIEESNRKADSGVDGKSDDD